MADKVRINSYQMISIPMITSLWQHILGKNQNEGNLIQSKFRISLSYNLWEQSNVPTEIWNWLSPLSISQVSISTPFNSMMGLLSSINSTIIISSSKMLNFPIWPSGLELPSTSISNVIDSLSFLETNLSITLKTPFFLKNGLLRYGLLTITKLKQKEKYQIMKLAMKRNPMYLEWIFLSIELS